ncbi:MULTISPECIES: type IV pili methyl-accepting chemotaxis transducer N-terminal domain-containing protein [Rhodobacterales]|uniref:type IV pili methyl-accepting chemotaxis transducer N-terminal domain-containing protein n=1 Tax=Rhodobacterales TaxID=204455 RepID=UPI0015F11B97|nr:MULTISPECIES: type IV pili methyl-accepting chemotaxis transducer N-terminal domain-containing protein [Rhodobacterales]MDO6589001.1 type IV pili methyl-accepting chemotaxis transducer N-terminal domain-containing protein [Yoonia sp. 1_MG-2023]
MIMIPKHLKLVFLLGAAYPATIVPSIALGQSAPIIEENAEQRINFSGKLRMLSQRVPSAACHFSRGIDVEGSAALLVAATTEFEKILTGLEFGDADLSIQLPETNGQTLALIAELRTLWEPLRAAAEAVANDTATEAERNYVLNENLPVLRAAQLLVERLVQQYSNPNATTFAALVLVDISGRQRMLTQKMSKESCILEGDFDTTVTVEDLQTTMRIFENSLDALQNGMPVVGVQPPPNDMIATGLDGVLTDWSGAKPYVTEVLAGNSLDADGNTVKFQQLNVTMANMNTVVGMYVDAAATLVPLDNM